jgi:hypothetical protein
VHAFIIKQCNIHFKQKVITLEGKQQTGEWEHSLTNSQCLQKNYTNAFHQAGLLNLHLTCNELPILQCYNKFLTLSLAKPTYNATVIITNYKFTSEPVLNLIVSVLAVVLSCELNNLIWDCGHVWLHECFTINNLQMRTNQWG